MWLLVVFPYVAPSFDFWSWGGCVQGCGAQMLHRSTSASGVTCCDEGSPLRGGGRSQHLCGPIGGWRLHVGGEHGCPGARAGHRAWTYLWPRWVPRSNRTSRVLWVLPAMNPMLVIGQPRVTAWVLLRDPYPMRVKTLYECLCVTAWLVYVWCGAYHLVNSIPESRA